LSNWSGCASIFETCDTWPSSFQVLAIALNFGSYTAPDGIGAPYILARGAAPISNISLPPAFGTPLPALGSTTVLADALDTEHRAPVSGDAVTYHVFAGPDSGATGSVFTDGDVAPFFPVNEGPGTDYVSTSFTDPINGAETSNNIIVTWSMYDQSPPTCTLTGVIAGPPKQIQITAQDTLSGLDCILVTTSTNATTSVPAFTPGTQPGAHHGESKPGFNKWRCW
jgi:hypothetical protein